MDFDKTKVLLKKINAIHDGVADGGGTFSSLEKDLILEYIRDLYESIRLKTDAPPAVTAPPPIEENKITNPEPPMAAPQIDPVIETRERSNGHHPEMHTNGHISQPKEQPTQTVILDVNPELEELFAESKLTDLSQRFANAPIKDVSKAMGINERILTINDLFKGDQQQFQLTSDTLNEYTSFAEAKAYLSKGPAAKYDWTNPKRKKKAAIFIKLVRRRYL